MRKLFAGLSKRDVASVVEAQLSLPSYARAGEGNGPAGDHAYDSNEAIWDAVLREQVHGSSTVMLRDFALSDWFPLSPGLFHTDDARFDRQMAQHEVLWQKGDKMDRLSHILGREVPEGLRQRIGGDLTTVYEPSGKILMMNGGVGSVRLQPRRIEGELTWLMSASSTRTAHDGFPVALPDGLYTEIADELYSVGTVRGSVFGRLCFVPGNIDVAFSGYTGVPKLHLLAEEIRRGPASGVEVEPFLISGGVTCERADSAVRDAEIYEPTELSGTYVTFRAGDPDSLRIAVDWLENVYLGELFPGRVVTDFDERTSRFTGAVFSLGKVMSGRVRSADVTAWAEQIGLTGAQPLVEIVNHYAEVTYVTNETKTITIGSNVTGSVTFRGDVVVADQIENSFNRVETSGLDTSVKELVEELTQAVATAASQAPPDVQEQLGRDVETLTKELTSPQPRRTWYELSIESLRSAATTLGEVATPILDLTTKLLPLLG